MKLRFVNAAAFGGCLLAACASQPRVDPQLLEQARSDVERFSHNPSASEVASREFTSARESLARAEKASKEEKPEDVDYYSYLAIRQARAGEAHAGQLARAQRIRGSSSA